MSDVADRPQHLDEFSRRPSSPAVRSAWMSKLPEGGSLDIHGQWVLSTLSIKP